MSLSQIAKNAGVSIATVSRVLNRSTKVRPNTARQVWRTIQELQGSREAATTNHASGATGNVGMLFLGAERAMLVGPIFHELISGISEELRELRLRMMVLELPDVSAIESELQRHELDGVIALFDSRLWQSDVPRRLAELVPAVWVMGPQSGAAVVDHVVPQNFGVGEMAFAYLRSRGCQCVAAVSLPVFRAVASRVSVMRAMAFANAARSEGMRLEIFSVDMNDAARRMLGGPCHQVADAEQLADCIVATLPRGSGIFLSTDQELARLYPLLLKRGIQPEEDYVFVSCDNESSTLAPLHPRPATIDINAKRIGREAVRRLMRRIRHPQEPPLVIEVPPTLVKADVGANIEM